MKKKILIVDDDQAIVESMTLILEDFGYLVESTKDGWDVYDINDNFPDLLLLDIWLSEHDGRKICRELKNNTITKDIPIILISAGKDIEESANVSGANDFLAKPFTMDELIQKVEKWTK